MGGLLGGAVVVAVVALAVAEVAPAMSGRPDTDLQVFLTGQGGLQAIRVDTGERHLILDDPDITSVTPVGATAVFMQPNPDSLFANAVLSYDDGPSLEPLGEADRVALDGNGGLWLVVDSSDGFPGGAVVTGPGGGSRSRVFTIPVGRQVIGAAADGLITLRGHTRGRTLQVWDPQHNDVLRSLGIVTGVVAVRNAQVLATYGCLSKGCQSAVVDTRTGRRELVVLPPPWVESGPASLSPDGSTVAQVVSRIDGTTGVAVGAPRQMTVNSSVQPAVGTGIFVSESGWLVVTTGDGDALLVRGSEQVGVELPPGSEVVAVGPESQ